MNLIIKGIRNPFYNIGLVNPIWEIRPAKSMSIEDSAACCLVKYSREIVTIYFGLGYQIYFGEEGDNIVILLCGGDKSRGFLLLAEEAGMTRNGYQKGLSEDGNPGFENINAIMQAMGYSLIPEKIEGASGR